MSKTEKEDIITPSKKRLNPYLKWGLILLPVMAIIGVAIWVISILIPANLLKIVPADSDIVVAIDGEQILEESGVNISIFGIEYSENVQELLDYIEKCSRLSDIEVSKCFDPRRIVFVTNVNNSSQPIFLESYLLISLFDRDDAEEFITSLDSNFKISYKNDYSISKVDYNTFFVLNDDYCWLHKISHYNNKLVDNHIEFTEDDIAKRIDEIVHAASENPILEDANKSSILNNDNAISACIDTKNFSEIANTELGNILPNVKFNEEKLAFNARFEEMSFISEATLYDKEWKQIPISPNSKKINESCAKWLNSKDRLSIAFTIDENTPWANIIEQTESITNTKLPKPEREQLLTFLTSLDGTVMCACGINGIIQAMNKSANLTSIIEIKEEKAPELFKLSSDILNSIDAQNIKQGDSVIEAEIDNNKIKMQQIGEKIIISNRQIEINGNDVMSPEFFFEKSFASMLYLNKSNFISRYLDLDGDVLLTTTCDNNKLSTRIEIKNLDKDRKSMGVIDFFFPCIIKILKKL